MSHSKESSFCPTGKDCRYLLFSPEAVGPQRYKTYEATPYIVPSFEALSGCAIVGSMEGCFGPALSSLPAFFLLSASSAPAVLSSLRSMTLIHLWSYALQERRFDALGASPYLWTEALRALTRISCSHRDRQDARMARRDDKSYRALPRWWAQTPLLGREQRKEYPRKLISSGSQQREGAT